MMLDKCILCLKALDESTPPEHIIPNSLGGRLKLQLLCAECNHGIGSRLYSTIKFDTWVRQAAWELKDNLPKIFHDIEKQQKYTTQSPTGTILSAKRMKSGIKITPRINNTEAILPTNNAISFIEKKLVKEHGLDNESAMTLARKISEAPNGKKMRIYKNFSFVRWDGDNFKPDFSKNTIVDPNAMVLMAFEYLALILGMSIYSEAFNKVRESINSNRRLVIVEMFLSPKPQQFHLLYPVFNNDKTIISIHLFEYLIVNVTFNNLVIKNSPDYCYLQDLAKQMSLAAWSVDDAKANNWYLLDE